MDFADLKERITLKRHVLNLPAGAVHSIHSENSDEERFKLRAGAKVPIPVVVCYEAVVDVVIS
eukprot:scaffold903_cov296-Ochromonas_danica.AAC.1